MVVMEQCHTGGRAQIYNCDIPLLAILCYLEAYYYYGFDFIHKSEVVAIKDSSHLQ